MSYAITLQRFLSLFQDTKTLRKSQSFWSRNTGASAGLRSFSLGFLLGFWRGFLSGFLSQRFLAGFCRKGFWQVFGGYMPKITQNSLKLVQINFKALFKLIKAVEYASCRQVLFSIYLPNLGNYMRYGIKKLSGNNPAQLHNTTTN